MNLSKSILITHKNCMDGSTCAILFMAAGGKKENIYFSDPPHVKVDELLLSLLNGTEDIILADISISKQLAEHLVKSGLDRHIIILLDHHKTAVDLNDFEFCTINIQNSSCGCKMFYDWLLMSCTVDHNTIRKYNKLVEIVDDYDRWIHNYSESRIMHDLFKVLGPELFVERFVRNFEINLTFQENYFIEIYNKKKEFTLRTRKQNIKKIVRTINGQEYKIGLVVAPGDDQNFISHGILDDFIIDVDFVIVINGEGVSLRAKNNCNIDLSKIAKLNGGGGHRAAAGCNLSSIFEKDFLELIAEKIKFEK